MYRYKKIIQYKTWFSTSRFTPLIFVKMGTQGAGSTQLAEVRGFRTCFSKQVFLKHVFRHFFGLKMYWGTIQNLSLCILYIFFFCNTKFKSLYRFVNTKFCILPQNDNPKQNGSVFCIHKIFFAIHNTKTK